MGMGLIVLLFCGGVALIGRGIEQASKHAPQPSAPTDEEESKFTPPGLRKPSPASVTLANYNRVRAGMSTADVFALLGPGQPEVESQVAGISTVSIRWHGTFGANCSVMFQNDRVIQKAQFGLR